jgi:hypothetical protein
MALEFFDAAGTAVNAGVFIPVSDLPGSLATELESGDSTASKTASFVFSVFKAIKNTLTTTSYLTTQLAGNILGQSYNLAESVPEVTKKNHSYSLTTTFLAKKSDSTIQMIPLNANSDGELLVTDIFPNAVKVAASGAVAAAGVLINSSDLVGFGGIAHTSLTLATSDGRQWLSSLVSWLFNTLTVRTASVASAITTKTRSTAIVTIPALATNVDTPSTGLLATSLDLYSLFNDTITITIQTQENDDETVSLSVVTA